MRDHHDPSDEPTPLSRRHLLAGLGATVGGGVVLAGGAAAAAAGPDAGSSTAPATDGRMVALSTPVTSTIASSPVTGVRYEYRSMFDFTPEGAGSQRTWGGDGVYTGGSSSNLWTSFDLPPGAVVHDIEWYVRNSGASARTALCRLWQAGTGSLFTVIVDTPIAASTPSVTAFRTVASATANGPFPAGCRALLGMTTPTDGSVQINGVRIGYRSGAGSVTLLPAPVRAYDSRSSGGALAPDTTRTIPLSTAIPRAATGALLTVSIVNTNGRGSLRMGAAGATPVVPVIKWAKTGDNLTQPATVAINSARQVAVRSEFSTGTTDVVVDVVGYLT